MNFPPTLKEQLSYKVPLLFWRRHLLHRHNNVLCIILQNTLGIFLPVILQFFFLLLAHYPSLYQPLYYLRRMFPIYDFLSNKKRTSHTYTLLYDIFNKNIYAKVIGFLSQVVKEKKHPNFHPLDLEILKFHKLQDIVNRAILVAQSCAHQDCGNLHIVELSIKPRDQG